MMKEQTAPTLTVEQAREIVRVSRFEGSSGIIISKLSCAGRVLNAEVKRQSEQIAELEAKIKRLQK